MNSIDKNKPKSSKGESTTSKKTANKKQKGGYIDPSMSMFNQFPLITAGKKQLAMKTKFLDPNDNSVNLGKRDMFNDLLKFKETGKEVQYQKTYEAKSGGNAKTSRRRQK